MLIRETVPHLRHLEEYGLRLFTQGSSREFQTLPCEASGVVRLVHVESPRRSDDEHGVGQFPLTDCLNQRNYLPIGIKDITQTAGIRTTFAIPDSASAFIAP
jgi:hypothetical protein